MARRAATALVEDSLLNEARLMPSAARRTIAGIISDLLAHGTKCSGLTRDTDAFESKCFILNRGSIEVAVRFLKGLIHFYSVVVLADDFDPSDPKGSVSVIVNPSPFNDLLLFSTVCAENVSVEFCDAYILLCENNLQMQTLTKIAELMAHSGRALVVIAEDIAGETIAALLRHKLLNGLKVAFVKAPGFGDHGKAILEDIAILTGGQLISDEFGMKLESVTVNMLGRAKKVVIDKKNTTIFNNTGKKKDIDARAGQIKAQIEEITSDCDREKLQHRLATFTGNGAVIRLEAEVKEMKREVFKTYTTVNEDVASDRVAVLRVTKTFNQIANYNSDAQPRINGNGVTTAAVAAERSKGPKPPPVPEGGCMDF
jgi:hypothetical protein